MCEVSSEIYKETNFQPTKSNAVDGKVVSRFKFTYPADEECPGSRTIDKDGDLIVCRRKTSAEKRTAAIEIEHSESTVLRLVGLQVWRGALLLADFLFHKRNELQDRQVLELGAGVGLASIAAAIYARKVKCTDVDIGGILHLIRSNIQRNQHLLRKEGAIDVLEYDFKANPKDYTEQLRQSIDDSSIVVAADVIYDNDLTDAFIRVLDQVFKSEHNNNQPKQVYIALEKRFVFTLSELDAVAPMFDYFLEQTITKPWQFEYIPLDFPQYFDYERSKQLVLLKLTSCDNPNKLKER